MGLVLGIHVGHDAACAVVRDGELAAAVQLERTSGVKHHALDSLSDIFPLRALLSSVGAELSDLDLIVSSFQGGSAGVGLHRPLIEPSFSLFDPFDPRHRALSHHLAHAHCAAAYGPDEDLALIISDYAGSATIDGADFAVPFRQWYEALCSHRAPVSLKSECLSIYRAPRAPNTPFELCHREYRTPQGSPSHVCSVGSLYEHVTECVFRKPHAHGSLMALAAYSRVPQDNTPMIDVDGEKVVFRNDWQHLVFKDARVDPDTGNFGLSFEQIAELAARCQDATERALLATALRASRLCGSRHLALAGGTFLNILANTRLAESGLFDTVSLPSAPHDAGIAVGCAFYGARAVGDRTHRVVHDRLGIVYPPSAAKEALFAFSDLVSARRVEPGEIAAQLQSGRIIARLAGRSEFGPRALGGRSLLASPLLAESKDRLNRIKGRQPWRPVAPVVARERLRDVFDGPVDSPWMTFSHRIPSEHRAKLPALHHPDDSTRAQSLVREQDPWLHDLLLAFEALTGYAVLVNTSLNGPDEPILETPEQGVRWLLDNDDVDALLLDETLIERKALEEVLAGNTYTPHPGAFVLTGPLSASEAERKCIVRVETRSMAVTSPPLRALFASPSRTDLSELLRSEPSVDRRELWRLVARGFFVRSAP